MMSGRSALVSAAASRSMAFASGAGEALGPLQVVGLLLASGAIVWLSGVMDHGWRSGRGVGTALVVAALIGLYTFSDGSGVRTVEEPLHYIVWSFFLGAVPLALTTRLSRLVLSPFT